MLGVKVGWEKSAAEGGGVKPRMRNEESKHLALLVNL